VISAKVEYFLTSRNTLLAAPSGVRHLAHSCVAALEKARPYNTTGIPCELRLAVNQMTNSHY